MTNPRCKLCRYFQESPFTFEKIFPSVSVLSSGFGSTKGGARLMLPKELHGPGI